MKQRSHSSTENRTQRQEISARPGRMRRWLLVPLLCTLVTAGELRAVGPTVAYELATGLPSEGNRFLKDGAVGDFNNDGKNDILVVDQEAAPHNNLGRFSIYVGRGDGTFNTTPLSLPLTTSDVQFQVAPAGPPDSYRIAGTLPFQRFFLSKSGDVNGSIHLRDYSYLFQSGTSRGLAMGDFNGDGLVDAAYSTGYSAWVAQAGSGYTPTGYKVNENGQNNVIAAGDFDGDGKADLAISALSDNTSFRIFTNVSGMISERTVTWSRGIASITTGDLNGDGKADIVLTGGSHVGILLNAATNSTIVDYATPGLGSSVRIADLNADGLRDVIAYVHSSQPIIFYLRNVGGGVFDGPYTTTVPTNNGLYLNPSRMDVADFNGDGRPELVVNYSAGFGILRPAAESLVVTTLTDENDGNAVPTVGAGVSLREALNYADRKPGPDTITFAPGLSGTISLTQVGGYSLGNVAFEVHSEVTVVGPATGAGITLARAVGAPEMRFFHTWQNEGDLTLRNLTLSGGRASAVSGISYGGALSNSHKMKLENCSITGSTATLGGAILQSGGDLTLRNCTLAGNSATYAGSAIYFNDYFGVVELTHVTVGGNNCSGSGGGAFFSQGTGTAKTVRNCVVSRNTGGDVVDVAFAPGSSHNQIGGDAMLGAVASNGGQTPTMLPQPGSPLVDAGADLGFTVDQRGRARPSGNAPDIGAVEVVIPAAPTFTNPVIYKLQSDPAFSLAAASGASPAGGTFSGTGVNAGQFSPSAAVLGANTVSYTISAGGDPGFTSSSEVTVIVQAQPVITSAASTQFVVGATGSFTISATGHPTPIIELNGNLPDGVSLDPGTGVLSGMPAAGSAGVYPLIVTARNNAGTSAAQNFTLYVYQAPVIESGTQANLWVGQEALYPISATGYPEPTLSVDGALPAGMSYHAGLFSGTPANGSGGVYPLTITANNGVGPAVTHVLTFRVNQHPDITSADATTFAVGSAGSFTVTVVGYPAPVLTGAVYGTPPSGVAFDAGTGILSGTPAPGSGGVYQYVFHVANGVGNDFAQPFTLTITEAPAITSAANAVFVVGTQESFAITASGYPAPTFSTTSPLPNGMTFSSNGVLSGTPMPGTGGVYNLTIIASNGSGTDATQSFSLTVNQAPAITSANDVSFTVGNVGSFAVETAGFPAPSTSMDGALPAGITFAGSVLGGIPADGSAGNYPLSFTATNGVGSDATQNFTLTVNDAICVEAPAGLTTWMPGEGNAADAEGGLMGSAMNGAIYAAGKVGQGFVFDGNQALVQVPDDAAWDFAANDFTVQAWVKFNAVSGSDVLVAHSDGDGNVNKWIFWLKNGSLAFHLNGSAVADITSNAGFAPVLGQWHHVAVSRSGNTYRFHVDGVQNGGERFDSNSVPAASGPLTFGKVDALNAINGMLDEAQIFSRALSAAEIASVYNASIKGLCFDALAAVDAVSRKTHGSAGDFDLPLPLSGAPVVESRGGAHRIVLAFNNTIASANATVSVGSVTGSPSLSGNTITIELANIPNAQSLSVTLSEVRDAFGQTLPSVTVPFAVLFGDVSGNGSVNASDIGQVKAESGTAVGPINFPADVNADGAINASDISAVKAAAGTSVP